jgi:hypothetical protein
MQCNAVAIGAVLAVLSCKQVRVAQCSAVLQTGDCYVVQRCSQWTSYHAGGTVLQAGPKKWAYSMVLVMQGTTAAAAAAATATAKLFASLVSYACCLQQI